MIRIGKWLRDICMVAHIGTLPIVTGMLMQWPAYAGDCTGRIQAVPHILVEYNPFVPISQTHQVSLTVENLSGKTCIPRLGFVVRDGKGGAAPRVRMQLETISGDLLGRGGIQSEPRWLVGRQIDPGQIHKFQFNIRMEAGQVLPPGQGEYVFDAVLAMNDQAKISQETTFADRRALPVIYRIRDQLSVNIAEAGRFKTLDFDELVSGKSKRVVIEARSNRNFQMRAFSRNHGALVMEAPNEQWQVEYAFQLNGRRFDFPALMGPFPVTPVAGVPIEAVFTIGDVTAKRAGLYTDEVTIKIEPAL